VSNPRAAAERRAKQTVRNLVLSLVVSFGLVVLMVLGVPRDDSVRIQQVDYLTEASAASASIGEPLVAPELSDDWWSNAARLESSLAVSSWYIGLVTPSSEFIGVRQAFVSNPSWVSLQLQGNVFEGEVEIAGYRWQLWQAAEKSNPPKSTDYALVLDYEPGTIVVFGTGTPAEFEELIQAMQPQLKEIVGNQSTVGSND
jgi:hypothetical protein